MKDNLVSIKSFSNEVGAQILQGKLKASGIISFIVKDDCGGTDPLMQMAFGVELQVHQRDAPKALKIISVKSYNSKHTKEKNRSDASTYLSLFSFLMNSIGIGLLVSGYAYYKQLISYGFLSLLIGLIFWSISRFKKAKSN
jgi:hypothetical protein